MINKQAGLDNILETIIRSLTDYCDGDKDHGGYIELDYLGSHKEQIEILDLLIPIMKKVGKDYGTKIYAYACGCHEGHPAIIINERQIVAHFGNMRHSSTINESSECGIETALNKFDILLRHDKEYFSYIKKDNYKFWENPDFVLSSEREISLI